MALTLSQKEHYLRQLILPEIGEAGQERLFRSSVLVVGVGGLGSPAAYYLAAAGIGRLGLVDPDQVALSNLQRQILHHARDIGRLKVESAKEKLQAFNPELTVEAHCEELNQDNAGKFIREYDICLSAVDNFRTRYLLNETCHREGRPLIEGAVTGFTGQVTTFRPPEGPCYQCLFPQRELLENQRSELFGVLGTVPGVIGTLQANEALKLILNTGAPLVGKLLVFDGTATAFTTVAFGQNPACPICNS